MIPKLPCCQGAVLHVRLVAVVSHNPSWRIPGWGLEVGPGHFLHRLRCSAQFGFHCAAFRTLVCKFRLLVYSAVISVLAPRGEESSKLGLFPGDVEVPIHRHLRRLEVVRSSDGSAATPFRSANDENRLYTIEFSSCCHSFSFQF